MRIALAAALALTLGAAANARAGEPSAKQLFGAVDGPSLSLAAPIGSYNRGCLAGGAELAAEGPGWRTMRPSRNRAWGAPATLALVARLGADARAVGWPGVLVGDISQPRGGPMRSGHASHQIGLDVDVWFTPEPARPLTVADREKMSAKSVVAADRIHLNDNWTPAHGGLLKRVAEDPAVARIFVNAAIKRRLCEVAPAGDRAWLRRLRPWWGHDDHFHVRLNCPDGAEGCVAQDPPPPGDGCDASLDWWFSDEALHPKPPKTPPKPKPELTLADLPARCRAVLAHD